MLRLLNLPNENFPAPWYTAGAKLFSFPPTQSRLPVPTGFLSLLTRSLRKLEVRALTRDTSSLLTWLKVFCAQAVWRLGWDEGLCPSGRLEPQPLLDLAGEAPGPRAGLRWRLADPRLQARSGPERGCSPLQGGGESRAGPLRPGLAVMDSSPRFR